MPNPQIYQLVYEILTEAVVVVNRKGIIIEANHGGNDGHL
jgi:hypothetical protein